MGRCPHPGAYSSGTGIQMRNYVNEQTQGEPKLRKFMSIGTLAELPDWSSVPRGTTDDDLYEALCGHGIEGLQGGDPELCRKHGMLYAGGARIDFPEEALPVAQRELAFGAVCATYHVGWGMEDDAHIDELAQAINEASAKTGLPMYIETHRATMFQDMYRTVKAIERNPAIMINGDFSHWYSGQEMPYGNWEGKLAFLQPVFERVGFFHGRIGNSSHIQVSIDGTEVHVDHYRDIWTRCMRAFIRQATPGCILPFTPEILPPSINYAREFKVDGELREESDRWQQALLYFEIAAECWRAARDT